MVKAVVSWQDDGSESDDAALAVPSISAVPRYRPGLRPVFTISVFMDGGETLARFVALRAIAAGYLERLERLRALEAGALRPVAFAEIDHAPAGVEPAGDRRRHPQPLKG